MPFGACAPCDDSLRGLLPVPGSFGVALGDGGGELGVDVTGGSGVTEVTGGGLSVWPVPGSEVDCPGGGAALLAGTCVGGTAGEDDCWFVGGAVG